MRSTYTSYSSRVVPLPSIPENEFLITPELIGLESQSSKSLTMKYSRTDSSLPRWEASDEEPRPRPMCCPLQWPFYMMIGIMYVFSSSIEKTGFTNKAAQSQRLSRLHRITSFPAGKRAVWVSWVTDPPSSQAGLPTVLIRFHHSCNDSRHHVPLYSTLKAECSSAKAGIWLDGAELRRGHPSLTL
jgi:hypothetical protein